MSIRLVSVVMLTLLLIGTLPLAFTKTLGLCIDVYTQYESPYGGQGPNNPSNMFGPQDEVCLFALVTYNEDPVQQKLVGFQITHDEFNIYRQNSTNEDGIAILCFKIPWPSDDPVDRVFGEWDVIATVEVAEQKVNDTLKFQVSWPIEIVSVKPTCYAHKNIVGQGYMLNIDVTVENKGYYNETFNVTAYVNETTVGTITKITLTGQNTDTITFPWNTTDFAYGNYTIRAVANIVLGETDSTDINFTDGWVIITIPGDVNGDFHVSMDDIVAVCDHFGSTVGQPKYDPSCDIDCNGRMDMSDIITACDHFGQTYP